MDDHTPPRDEDERWQIPGRNCVRVGRGLIIVGVGLVVVACPWVLDRRLPGGEATLWQDVMSVIALLCVAPIAALVWPSVSKPYPRDRTMLVLTRALDPADREDIVAALKRGLPVRPEQRAYACALVAQQRHSILVFAVVTPLVWSQALNVAGREIGTWVYWLFTLGAVGMTAAAVVMLRNHIRCERVVREFAT